MGFSQILNAGDVQIREKGITRSICAECSRVIPAVLLDEGGCLFLERTCPEHGKQRVPHFLENTEYYEAVAAFMPEIPGQEEPAARIVDITYRCNADCAYCFASANERPDTQPELEQIIRDIGTFHGPYVYLSGGEPTLRDDLFAIIRALKKKKYQVVLVTNAKKLVASDYVRQLESAGLDYVQVPFETFDEGESLLLENECTVAIKLKALENIRKTSMKVFLWVRLVRGINEGQIGPIVDFVAARAGWIKYIVFAPAWQEGRARLPQKSLSRNETMHYLRKHYGIQLSDYLEDMTFYALLFSFFDLLTNKPIARSSPCTARCHCFVFAGRIRVLAQMVPLTVINGLLYRLLERIRGQRGRLGRLITGGTHFPYVTFLRYFLGSRNARAYIIDTLKSFFQRREGMRSDASVFTIGISPFMDRNNFDARLAFSHCHMRTQDHGVVMPLCLREILRNKGITQGDVLRDTVRCLQKEYPGIEKYAL